MGLHFGRLSTQNNGQFTLTIVGDGTSNAITVDLSKGPEAMDLKGVQPTGVVQTSGAATKAGVMTLSSQNPMQVVITLEGVPMLVGQLTDLAGFLTFAGVPPPAPAK